MNTIDKICLRTLLIKWKIIVAIMAVCLIPFFGSQVMAGPTCKSKVDFPGTTTAKVNVREKAGTKYKTFGMVASGTKIKILSTCKNNNQLWYKVKVRVNGKTKTGYIYSDYVKKGTNLKGVVEVSDGSSLNMREKSSATSSVLAILKNGTNVTVTNFTGDWYKIKYVDGASVKRGFVKSTYLKVYRTKATQPVSPGDSEDKEQTGYVNDLVSTYLNVRESASTSAAILTRIPPKTKVSILQTSGDWYKVKVTYEGKTVTGYVAKQYITIDNTIDEEKPTDDEEKPEPSEDEAFEVLLKKFPASYQSSLKELHKSYPKWKFVAIDTGLDWSEVIKNESVVGRNVIQSNYPRGTSSLAPFSYLSTSSGAYDWSTDRYVLKDGVNWYSANSQVISYYMDPRNFLNANDIFQFEALAYEESQKSTVVQSILSNTFMKGSYEVVDSATNKTVSGTYKKAFMDAGTKAKASPYFLAVRCKQEVGVNGSASTSGTYPGYVGIYNFYNIGAFDGKNAVAQGLSWASTGTAYGKPWTTPYKSIVGGAQYIASNYINVGQNTLYFQKFNVKPNNPNNLYIHQYMTNVQAPYSEGRSTRSAYNSLGILGDEMVFYIPVYKNMPSAKCTLPATAGNPNPYLSSITVKNGSKELALTPTFVLPSASGALDTDTYTMVVDKDVKEVTVSAKAISKYTAIEGTGTYVLGESGTTKTVKVTGKAQNGTSQVYKIKITRK